MPSLASIIFLTYNQKETVEEALQSLLAQTYSPLEIVISDDHSVDGTWDVIQRCVAAYQGPHVIRLNQNSINLGINANYNQAFSIASGELILIAAGDDVSLPERASLTMETWLKADKRPRLICSPVIDMDIDGTLGGVIEVSDLAQVHSLEDWLSTKPYVIGAGHAWHRSLFRDFASLPVLYNHEDQIAAYRAALLDSGITLNVPLVKYRRGGASSEKVLGSTQEWLKKRHFDAVRHAAFWRQMEMDSELFSVTKKIKKYIRRRYARCTFESNMLEASGLLGCVRVFLTHPETDLAFRLRTFFNVRFADMVFKLKVNRISH